VKVRGDIRYQISDVRYQRSDMREKGKMERGRPLSRLSDDPFDAIRDA